MVLVSNEPQPNMGFPGTGGFTLAILDGGDAEAMASNWREEMRGYYNCGATMMTLYRWEGGGLCLARRWFSSSDDTLRTLRNASVGESAPGHRGAAAGILALARRARLLTDFVPKPFSG